MDNEEQTGSTGPVTCARLRDWVRGAKPNARLPIGSGFHAKEAYRSAELREYVLMLAEMGLLTPHISRAGDAGLPLYLVQRTRRPVPAGAKL